MLGILSTDADTGLYNAAYRVYEGLTYVPAILSAVLTPRLSREYVTDRARHRALARLGLVSSVALAAVVAAVTWMVGEYPPVAAVRCRFRPGQPIALDPRERPARRLSDLDPAGRGHVHVG